MTSKLTKILAMALALVMVVAVFASCAKDPVIGDDTTAAGTNPDDGPKGYVDDGKTYSYRMGPSDLPESWNVQTYQSNSSTYVLDYSSDALYTFEYNDNYDGYKIVPSMAADFPVDVTKDYVGKFGIADGEENKAYKIALKTNLKFDNGEVLNAKSFVDSMKLLLNPEAANFRADNVYASGNLKIYGSEEYVKQGSTTMEDCTGGAGVGSGKYTGWNFGDTGAEIPADLADNVFFDLLNCYVNKGWAGKSTAEDVAALFSKYTGIAAEDLLAMDGKSLSEIRADEAMMANLQVLLYDFWCTDPEEPWGFFCYKNVWEAYDFANVGFFALDDNTLVIVLKNAMEDNFYLRYELCTSFFLVYAPMYESLITKDNGVYANTYGTSVDTYVGFGPYKLTSYTEGAEIVLERNLNWHGYTPEEYVEGTYMTDRVTYKKVADNATRLEMFLKGEIDSYGLQTEDMEDYIGSEYTYFDDSESTWYLALNPQEAKLTETAAAATPLTAGNTVIKTPLCIEEFRSALSYSLDRQSFNKTLSPTSGVAKALLSNMIIADPETGMSYRSLDVAKDAILNFWGLADKWGEGKEYATRDDAIDSITGYDPEGAKVLFDKAYDKAVELGYITEAMIADGKSEVQIIIGRPSEGNYYTKGYEFLSACWTEAVKGTKFEGHLTFVQSQVLGSSSFGTYLREGNVDLLFGVGYGGSMFDPYSMMDCFTGSLQYDPFTDKSTVMLDIALEGKTLRASLYDWVSECLQGNKITATVVGADGNATSETVEISAGTSDPSERRTTILAAAETKVMTLANIFPIQTDASASLRCMRVNYKTEDYILGMGRGGVEWYTYSMTDEEFVNYAKGQENGVLNYK